MDPQRLGRAGQPGVEHIRRRGEPPRVRDGAGNQARREPAPGPAKRLYPALSADSYMVLNVAASALLVVIGVVLIATNA